LAISVYLVIVLQWIFTEISKPKKAKQSTNYFGRRVSVLFDDGKEYVGVIIGKDSKSSEWITWFEDGVEDKCLDPAIDDDYTPIN